MGRIAWIYKIGMNLLGRMGSGGCSRQGEQRYKDWRLSQAMAQAEEQRDGGRGRRRREGYN